MTDQPPNSPKTSDFFQMVDAHFNQQQPTPEPEVEVVDDRFLQNSVSPIPIFKPMPQTAMTYYKDKSQKTNVPFTPDVRQLLMNMLFHMIKTPIRELQVLAYHQEACVVFFLPHGFTSYRESGKGPDIYS